jgi:hypothetical protein
MPIVISDQRQSKYALATEGLHKAEIVSVKDIGDIETPYGPKPHVQFVWILLDERDAKDKYVTLMQRYPRSVGEKARLRKLLNELGIKDPLGFDLEKLLNTKADIVVSHNVSGNRTFANISTVVAGTVRIPTAEDRAEHARKQQEAARENGHTRAEEPIDDDLGF